MITLGAVMSTSGNNMGQALSGSRNLYALAEQGDLPRFFGYVHPRFRTPVNAILVTAGVSLVLALSGSFATLAAASAISRLLVYVATCASMMRLRDARFSGKVNPPQFIVPGGPIVPAVAILIALAILFGATRQQLISGGYALAAGAVLYLIALRTHDRLLHLGRLDETFGRFSWALRCSRRSSMPQPRTRCSSFVTPSGRMAALVGATSMANDPDLSDVGRTRAQALATALKDAGVTAIFVTEYKRTQQTAEPLAKLLGIQPDHRQREGRAGADRQSQGGNRPRLDRRTLQHRP